MDDLIDASRIPAWDGTTPFPLLVARDVLGSTRADAIAADFPRYPGAGFFPYGETDCGPTVRGLVEQMTSREFGARLGRALGVPDLGDMPTLATLCHSLNRRHGTIHTDSRSKVVTALLYLNPAWPDTSAGCLRFLSRIDDIDALVAPEVRPVYGTLAAFRRMDTSFHGHLPFEGERRVIQVAWLASEADKARKTRRGRTSRGIKRLLGALDRRFGADRDRNAAHRD